MVNSSDGRLSRRWSVEQPMEEHQGSRNDDGSGETREKCVIKRAEIIVLTRLPARASISLDVQMPSPDVIEFPFHTTPVSRHLSKHRPCHHDRRVQRDRNACSDSALHFRECRAFNLVSPSRTPDLTTGYSSTRPTHYEL